MTAAELMKTVGLPADPKAAARLEAFAALVWEKRTQLNLTSVDSFAEIMDRHIADALHAAAAFRGVMAAGSSIADAGAGAGYIGLGMKIVLPASRVFLVEAIERRCAFMNWACFKLGLKNVEIIRAQATAAKPPVRANFVTERAMGKLEDILPACLAMTEAGGIFCAFQTQEPDAEIYGAALENIYRYALPRDGKPRTLALFRNKAAN